MCLDLSLMSVYAPTAKATPSVKAKFTDDFQRNLDTLPTEDAVMVLGDFNSTSQQPGRVCGAAVGGTER